MPVVLLNLYRERGSTFKTLREALKLLAEPADDGLTHAGALLSRSDRTMPQHVLWVNVEVPAEVAPGVMDREKRFYPIAIQVSEQLLVEQFHPWLHYGSYESYLQQMNAFALSHVMDGWRQKHDKPVHYFVIEIQPSRGDPKTNKRWQEFYVKGDLVLIRKEKEKWQLYHSAEGREELEQSYGPGKHFWMDMWLNGYWRQRTGYYVGVEAQEKDDPRIWAALAPSAQARALTQIQYLCQLVHHAGFRRVVSRIPECQPKSGRYRLYQVERHQQTQWHVIYKDVHIVLKRTAAWPYIMRLFERPGQYLDYSKFSGTHRTKRSPTDSTELPPLGTGSTQRLPTAEQSIAAEKELRAIRQIRELHNERRSIDGATCSTGPLEQQATNARLTAIDTEIKRILADHPTLSQKLQRVFRETKPEIAMQRLENNLKNTALPKHANPHNPRDFTRERSLTDRVNRAIAREIQKQEPEHPEFARYLRTAIKNDHGQWIYNGSEVWEFSPPSSSDGGTGSA